MISAESRYSDSTLVTVTSKTGDRIAIVPGDPSSYTFNYVNYVTKGLDRIDLIANAFYGDPKIWWRIADANPEIMDWSVLPAGKLIRIPNIS